LSLCFIPFGFVFIFVVFAVVLFLLKGFIVIHRYIFFFECIFVISINIFFWTKFSWFLLLVT
jgi:hypothetical protein